MRIAAAARNSFLLCTQQSLSHRALDWVPLITRSARWQRSSSRLAHPVAMDAIFLKTISHTFRQSDWLEYRNSESTAGLFIFSRPTNTV